MNWDQIEGKWTKSKGRMKKKWGKLTDDDLQLVTGAYDEFVGLLQERYGFDKAEAEEEVKEFAKFLEADAKEKFERRS